ncbi:GumC family protein [Catalinimonas niigatensis]|uniref:GumC family protein n=1 Tax=Catalinimonas niigatensis TaxID=1397264 RepID=UPI002666F99F|nr:tyrosine-protein kinase family protein [Catalinimonas niigatensis]WPP52910.1 polysaccharide biosynthesis tyrosine autokinase [Catalinimonas niigatensis]
MGERELFQIGSGGAEEINIKAILLKYLRYWYLFMIGIIVCLIFAFIHLRYYTTPQYYINSTLLIKDEQGGSGLSSEGLGGLDMFRSSKSIGNEIVILKSRSLMQRVLSELSFNASYYVEGRVRDVEVYAHDLNITLIVSKLDPLAFGKSIKIHIKDHNNFELIEKDKNGNEVFSTYKFGQEINKPYASFTVIASADMQNAKDITVKFQDIRKLAEKYSRKLMIEPINKGASVLNIGLSEAVPQRGINIINKLIEVYNKEAIEDKKQVATSTIGFLDDRIQYLSMELSEVEKSVEEYKQQNDLTDVSSNAQMYLQRANEYNKQLADYEIQLDILNSLEDYVKKEELELVPSSLNISDPTLNSLLAKFNELQLERQRMLRTTQPSSSLILNMDDQLTNLRVNITENLKNIKNGLLITKNNLQSSSARFESRIQRVPSIERALLEINRQQSIKQEIYLYLLQKREEAGLSLASTTANSRIIDPATAGDYPISPKKSSIYLVSLMLGLFLPFAFVYVKEMLNDRVQTQKDVEKATTTPILGEIYHNTFSDHLIVTENKRTPITELFRLIRANLHFATLGKQNKVILVTSSMSGEGKTFFSINLGASLALSGKRVVVISFDLRKPKLMYSLKLPDKLGVTNYLVSDNFSIASLAQAVKAVPGLFAIGTGPLPPNPAELMMGTKVKQLMDELRKQFDYVIVDSSPIGQVADTFNLAPYIDSTLYIVRYNFSYKNQMAIVQDIYQNKKLKHPMIVLNDAKKKNKIGYGYGYGYGYEYSNGQEKEKSLSHK